MRYSIPLTANVPKQVRFQGKNITIMDTGGASEVNLALNTTSQQEEEDFGAVGRNFSIFSPDHNFTGATFTSAIDTTVDLIVTNFRVETIDGTTLTATISAGSLPLPVEEVQASAAANNAAVAVGAAGAVLLAANAARIEARFSNIGSDPVAIGFAGLTWAKRCVVLNPGDTWVENRAAGLAWAGITDAGLAASVTVQELTA